MTLHREQMAAVSGIYRAVASIRHQLENSVLRSSALSWTGFVVLWIVWIGGEMETRDVAQEASISKGTPTGVAKTLQSRGLVERRAHPTDGRLALLRLTPSGEELMQDMFPRFNDEHVLVSGPLGADETQSLANMLDRLMTHLREHGEQRRIELRGGNPLPPRRSGRRPAASHK